MTESVRRVAVFTHLGRPDALDAARRLIGGLAAAGLVCAVPAADHAALGSALDGAPLEPIQDLDDVDPRAYELMVVLGGDGTILRAAEWVLAADVPLLGVNLGHVGFLAEAELSEIDAVVERIVACSYTVEERFVAEVTVRDQGEVCWTSYAVNEVSVEKAARERMLELLLEVDGRPLSRWACDGLLVATPTGSTAYAFSAGGPIIWPGVDALLVVPLSAHALFARPMVLGPTSRVVVELLDGSEVHGVIWCDGHRSTELRAGMEIEVSGAGHRLRLARLSELPFTDRLVRKFRLRVEGWRGAAEQDRAAEQDLAAATTPGSPEPVE